MNTTMERKPVPVMSSVAPSVTSTSTAVKPTPVPKGAYAPDIIVLLTDGASNFIFAGGDIIVAVGVPN